MQPNNDFEEVFKVKRFSVSKAMSLYRIRNKIANTNLLKQCKITSDEQRYDIIHKVVFDKNSLKSVKILQKNRFLKNLELGIVQ